MSKTKQLEERMKELDEEAKARQEAFGLKPGIPGDKQPPQAPQAQDQAQADQGAKA